MLKLTKKQTILKNFFAVNLSMVFLFAAINSTASVQTVLNQIANLGITSQMVGFGTQILTSLVFPSLVCDIFGFKYSFLIAELLHTSYVCVQLYPEWFTLIPSWFYFKYRITLLNVIQGTIFEVVRIFLLINKN